MRVPTGTSGKLTRCSASASPAIPDLSNLYLPNGFLGNPLRKTFPLLSREVKPWPGKVDVEAMPEEEEAEGADGDEEPASESEDGEEA